MNDAKILVSGAAPPTFEALLGIDQSVLDAVPSAVYVCSAEGVLVRHNRRAVELWGRSPRPGDTDERFCGAFRLYHLDGRHLPHANTPMETVLRTGEPQRSKEVIIERPDGSRVIVQVNIEPLRGRDGRIQGAINCFQDITERRKAEEELKTIQSDLEDFFENAAVAMHWLSVDGTILRANQAELDMLGYTSEEYLGRPIAEFHTDRAAIEEMLGRFARGEKLYKVRANLRAKDGSTKRVLISSSPLYRDGKLANTRCMTLDATAERLAYQLAAIVDSAEDAIVGKDLKGIITSWNRGAERLFGYLAEEVSGKSITILIPSERQDEETRILTRIRRGERVKPYETIRRRKDGSLIDISLTVSPVIDAEGRVVGASKIARDITKRKRDEQALAGRVREQAALYKYVDRLHRAARSAADAYEATFDAIFEALDCKRAAILLFDDAGIMRFVAWRGLSERYRAAVEGHSPWKAGAREPDPIFIDDIDAADESDALKAIVRAEGIRALAFIPLMARGAVIGKFMAYYEAPRVAAAHEKDLAITIGRQLGFSLERLRAEEARTIAEERLREKSAQLDMIMATVPALIWIAHDREARHITGSRYAAELLQLPPDRNQSLGASPAERPDGFRIVKDGEEVAVEDLPVQRAARGEEVRDEELELVFADGSARWEIVNATPVWSGAGKPIGAVGAGLDITERKEAEQNRKLLVDELNHRVKNTLAIVQGLAQQTFRGENVPPEVRQTFEGRLAALAAAHNLLTRGNWEKAFLHEIAAEAILTCGPAKSRVSFEGPSILLQPKQAGTIAMALHELCTNAVKYGALSNDSGRVTLNWSISDGTGPRRLKLVWRESGGPAVSPPSHRGFGTRLIEQGLAQDLRGNVVMEFNPEGLVCTIDAPLPSRQKERHERVAGQADPPRGG